ncbi:GTP cyclohydrolase I, partial [Streptococcus thoraltensis]
RADEGAAHCPEWEEMLTAQVAKCFEETMNPKGVFVKVETEQMCMAIRGNKKPGNKTITT